MQYKMPNGTIGEPQAITDLERNNRLLAKLTLALKIIGAAIVLEGLGLITIICWILYMITKYNMVTVFIQALGG